MRSVADGIKSQLANIEKNYGHSIGALTEVIGKGGLTKHSEVVAMLKERYGMAHGAAHRVSLTARDHLASQNAASPTSVATGLEPLYDKLLSIAVALGPDVEQAQKKGYVSLRRRKQFAMLQPGARWVNVGLVLPAVKPAARLESAAKWNALFSHRHRVRVHATSEVDAELRSWLLAAYRAAG